jgi:hypothetical protein
MAAAPAQLSQLEDVFGSLVTSLLALGGIVLFLMLLNGGFKYLTSGGDPKATEGAQKTLTYAIGGLVLLAGSYMILNIIKSFTGADVTNFVIYKP